MDRTTQNHEASGSRLDSGVEPPTAGAGAAAWGYLDLDDETLVRQCEVDLYRASGPGGQKRNKTESAVRLRHQPTGLIVIATESRSQHDNRRKAVKRLREAIALKIRSDMDLAGYQPSEVLRSCFSHAGRLNLGLRDRRYPRVLAEILDVLRACEGRLRDTGDRLGIPTADLNKLLRDDPAFRTQANAIRREFGLRELH